MQQSHSDKLPAPADGANEGEPSHLTSSLASSPRKPRRLYHSIPACLPAVRGNYRLIVEIVRSDQNILISSAGVCFLSWKYFSFEVFTKVKNGLGLGLNSAIYFGSAG